MEPGHKGARELRKWLTQILRHKELLQCSPEVPTSWGLGALEVVRNRLQRPPRGQPGLWQHLQLGFH